MYIYVYTHTAAAAAAKSCQLCPTLCNPIDSSPTGSSVLGILQARILEWAAIPLSTELPGEPQILRSSIKRKIQMLCDWQVD